MPRCDHCSVNSDGFKEIVSILTDGFFKTSLPLNTEVSCSVSNNLKGTKLINSYLLSELNEKTELINQFSKEFIDKKQTNRTWVKNASTAEPASVDSFYKNYIVVANGSN